MAPRLLVSVCLALFLTLACGAALGFAAPPQPLSGNPADRLADRPIDDGDYDHASRCRRRPSPGALALEQWLRLHVRGMSWGSRDHIHVGLSRAGAAKRTSFWR